VLFIVDSFLSQIRTEEGPLEQIEQLYNSTHTKTRLCSLNKKSYSFKMLYLFCEFKKKQNTFRIYCRRWIAGCIS